MSHRSRPASGVCTPVAGSRRARHSRIAWRLVLAALVLAAASAGCSSGDDDGDNRAGGEAAGSCEFDTDAWVALDPDDEADGAQRHDLAARLVDCDLLDDATRDKVLNMLGSAGGDPDAERWEYLVAPGSFAPDYELLVISFGPDDRVTSVSWGQS